NLSDVDISTDGYKGYGIWAKGGSKVTLTDGSTISTKGSDAYAIYLQGAGTSLEMTGGSIKSNSSKAQAIYVKDGADLTVNDASIDSNQVNRSVFIDGAGTTAQFNNTQIAHHLYVSNGA